MYLEKDEFEIGKFARKPVQRLSNTSNLLDAIELMNDFSIRYIPIVEGVQLLGVIDSHSLTEALLYYTDASTLEEPVTHFLSSDYFKVTEHESVLDAIKKIAVSQPCVALIMDGYVFQGMFTDVDILHNDYLWTEMDDFPIHPDTEIGREITEYSCVSADASIQQALQMMLYLKTDVIGLIDDHSKVLVGTLSFMDIIEHVMGQIKDVGHTPDRAMQSALNTIFPRTGLYVKEPITLSELRSMMIDSDSYLSILLNDGGYPVRMISVHDLVMQYATHSRFI